MSRFSGALSCCKNPTNPTFGISTAAAREPRTRPPQAGPAASQRSSTGASDSLATCYTPQQLQVAYGITPLLDRGINGRGETVVFPSWPNRG